ncbi:unnamed protein product [Ranitomeya imitator]|uniref:Uncharacterized protein n=1 Tax=Ranitomeya imitator TaxID=111125 RepID=A0ABN9LVT0_9NEOB|nr:unnamed protein product [Ranitomeya imitator]
MLFPPEVARSPVYKLGRHRPGHGSEHVPSGHCLCLESLMDRGASHLPVLCPHGILFWSSKYDDFNSNGGDPVSGVQHDYEQP